MSVQGYTQKIPVPAFCWDREYKFPAVPPGLVQSTHSSAHDHALALFTKCHSVASTVFSVYTVRFALKSPFVRNRHTALPPTAALWKAFFGLLLFLIGLFFVLYHKIISVSRVILKNNSYSEKMCFGLVKTAGYTRFSFRFFKKALEKRESIVYNEVRDERLLSLSIFWRYFLC